jgi:hypothetical protein
MINFGDTITYYGLETPVKLLCCIYIVPVENEVLPVGMLVGKTGKVLYSQEVMDLGSSSKSKTTDYVQK